jgi:peptidoglycan-N-acetylglucosamine deacetylase
VPTRLALRAALYSYPARAAGALLPGCVSRIASRGRSVFLTFDDGPDLRSTPQLLDRLAAHGARATFFLLGEQAARQPGLVRRIIAQGHAVGQHGYEHLDAWRTPSATVIEGMARASRAIEDITGRRVAWARPPYGHVTPATLRWARENDQRVALWDVMPADFLAGARADAIARVITARVRLGSLVVMHDSPRFMHVTPATLEIALPALSARGFTFEAL